MKTLKMHELIENFEKNKEVLYEQIAPYKKQLFIYYSEFYGGEPVLLITTVTNSIQGCIIVPDHMLYESVTDYLGGFIIEDENDPEYNDDLYCEYETILANSMYFKNML